ncbi:hypothetical protein XENOCAPTIV_013845 [Xenoophorus captivus]|uniref:RING-type domain-containing protein n=1 Tax=Xenoophorus captivus TaxID=1517983 RepID=A0ABV0R091_9TELE
MKTSWTFLVNGATEQFIHLCCDIIQTAGFAQFLAPVFGTGQNKGNKISRSKESFSKSFIMNPYGDASGFSSSPYSASNLTYSFDPPKPLFIHTDQSSLSPSPVVHFPSDNHIRTSSSTLPLPAFSPTASSTIDNPYPPPAALHSHQVSIPSPDLQSSPPQTECFDENAPDLECAICFSQFNNIFRCPKMLNCKHTFCLECLARMNVKSSEPSAIQCPLCRGLTPLPPLGLPKLATDSDVLSYLPAAMQRVYSIRFIRNKGKLQVKRSG